MKGYKILLVDDEEPILDSVSLALSDWAASWGISIITVQSAEEGLEFLKAEREQVALIVSDMRMPGMKGGDFRRHLLVRPEALRHPDAPRRDGEGDGLPGGKRGTQVVPYEA